MCGKWGLNGLSFSAMGGRVSEVEEEGKDCLEEAMNQRSLSDLQNE